MANIYCTKCGQPNEEGANFCRACGAPLKGGQTATSVTQNTQDKSKVPYYFMLTIAILLVVFVLYRIAGYMQCQQKCDELCSESQTNALIPVLGDLSDALCTWKKKSCKEECRVF